MTEATEDQAAVVRRLSKEIERLWEAVYERPELMNFEVILMLARRMLSDHFPADIFTGVSGDPGPQLIVAIRAAVERIDALRVDKP